MTYRECIIAPEEEKCPDCRAKTKEWFRKTAELEATIKLEATIENLWPAGPPDFKCDACKAKAKGA